MSFALPRALLVLVAASLLAGIAGAQVDLPRKRGSGETGGGGEQKGGEAKGKETETPRDLAPHLVCSICFERNYTTPIDPSDADGLQSAHCLVCRKVTIHQQPASTAKGEGDLELPRGSSRVPPPEAEPPRQAGDPGAMETRMGVARGYFESLERSTRVESRVIDQAVESLVLLGSEGVSAARLALLSEHPAVFTASAKVLLRSKESSDHDLVAERLRGRLPQSAAADAVDELVLLDPVRATPSYLIALLEHPQAVVRGAAQDHLFERMSPELLPLLHPVLRSRTADTRMRAIDLATSVEGASGMPAVTEILLDRIADSSARVASLAVRSLAASTDPRVDFELAALAFRDRWILRENAYALLAMIEREDKTLAPQLNEGHVEALLGGLASTDPFVSGTCASALAGIGFRSSELRSSDWLDREVPDRLVTTVAGHVYFDDFSSLRGPAQRRLKDIAGVDFGSDGPRWAEWWIETRESFRASRATLRVVAGDEDGLEVQFKAGGEEATVFQLLGPVRAIASGPPMLGETVYLTHSEAGEVVDLLQREGMLSVRCLPGQRGSPSPAGRSLDVRLAGQSKYFAFAPGLSEPWFERAAGMMRALRDRNRWQRFPDPAVHGDRLGLWRAQAEWWTGESDPRARALALKSLVLAHLEAVPAGEWESGIAELERLETEQAGLLGLEDFDALARLLDTERYFTQRASRVLALAERAGGLDESPRVTTAVPSAIPDDGAAGVPSDGDAESTLDGEALARADRLIDLLVHRFDVDATAEVAGLLLRAGHERTRAAARDARSLLRAIAASVLARDPSAEDIGVILELLRDSNEEVEIAAVMALGEQRVEAGRTELLVRARLGTPLVRAAALRAIGRLGGESVLDALTVALTDPDPELKLAAAEGLASLDDSRATPMLVSLLRQGRDAPWYEAVRAGLSRQGAAAEEALLSMLRAPGLDMQREGALLLSARGRPEAVPALLRVLHADKADRAVADELAVISCVDHRAAEDPAGAWIEWWGSVVHDDPLAWFRAALEQRGMSAPTADGFVPPGTPEARSLCLDVLRRGETPLDERARRELEKLLERELGPLPPAGDERQAWLDVVAELVARSRD